MNELNQHLDSVLAARINCRRIEELRVTRNTNLKIARKVWLDTYLKTKTF